MLVSYRYVAGATADARAAHAAARLLTLAANRLLTLAALAARQLLVSTRAALAARAAHAAARLLTIAAARLLTIAALAARQLLVSALAAARLLAPADNAKVETARLLTLPVQESDAATRIYSLTHVLFGKAAAALQLLAHAVHCHCRPVQSC